MSSKLRIFSIDITEKNNRQIQIFEEIAYIAKSDLIDKLEDRGHQYWHCESECGSTFELLGKDILEFAGEIISCDINFEWLLIDTDDFYRCEVSW